MESIQQMKAHIDSIAGTRQITQSMRLVSTVRLRTVRERMLANANFLDETVRMFREAASEPETFDHPYVRGILFSDDNHGGGALQDMCVIVVGSDRGLCGGYNINVCKEARALIQKSGVVKLITVGLKTKDYFTRYGVGASDGGDGVGASDGGDGVGNGGRGVGASGASRPTTSASGGGGIVKSFTGISETPFFEDAEEIASTALDLFNGGHAGSIYIVYTRFISMLSQVATAVPVLPCKLAANPDSAGTADGSGSLPAGSLYDSNSSAGSPTANSPSDSNLPTGGLPATNPGAKKLRHYEPGCAEFLTRSAPFYAASAIFGAILESSVCEQCARTISMDTAVKNSDDMIEALMLKYNQARQTGINSELADIIGGTRALRSKTDSN